MCNISWLNLYWKKKPSENFTVWNPQLFFISSFAMDLISCENSKISWRHNIRVSRGMRLLGNALCTSTEIERNNLSFFVSSNPLTSLSGYSPAFVGVKLTDYKFGVTPSMMSPLMSWWRAQPKLFGTPIVININLPVFYHECHFLPGTTIRLGWLLRKKLNATTTWQSPNWKPRIATAYSCRRLGWISSARWSS